MWHQKEFEMLLSFPNNTMIFKIKVNTNFILFQPEEGAAEGAPAAEGEAAPAEAAAPAVEAAPAEVEAAA